MTEGPWLQDPDVTLYHGDVLTTLRELPAESVDCVVTSPPYWGLRDYGTGAWEGGDAECDHQNDNYDRGAAQTGSETGGAWLKTAENRRTPMLATCGKCGATRIDQQLGLEPTPEQYVERMVEVFREVRRVLAAHGTVWLNLGDSYASGTLGRNDADRLHEGLAGGHGGGTTAPRMGTHSERASWGKPKDLVGIPWRVAFALQADGWYLRSDIIWSKPNPMPESVTDRPTKAHEYVFLLSKQPRYFFDQEAVREALSDTQGAQAWRKVFDPAKQRKEAELKEAGIKGGNDGQRITNPAGRNIRSVWEIATQPYPEAHFATFPEELARRCIAAGTSEKGKCPECGAPWVREIEKGEPVLNAWSATGAGQYDNSIGGMRRTSLDEGSTLKHTVPRETTGWRASCACGDLKDGHHMNWAVPCVVLDPFMGSGTVAHVARKLGRHAVGIDLNESYLELAARRLQQQSLFAESL